jgi:hypothetical protein
LFTKSKFFYEASKDLSFETSYHNFERFKELYASPLQCVIHENFQLQYVNKQVDVNHVVLGSLTNIVPSCNFPSKFYKVFHIPLSLSTSTVIEVTT